MMVSPEIVNLFVIQTGPEICADKLDHVQLILEPAPLSRQSFNNSVSNTESHPF